MEPFFLVPSLPLVTLRAHLSRWFGAKALPEDGPAALALGRFEQMPPGIDTLKAHLPDLIHTQGPYLAVVVSVAHWPRLLDLMTHHAPDLSRLLSGLFEAPAKPSFCFKGRSLDLSRPAVMGILNLTPDSFSDGGRYNDFSGALERAEEMLQQGADLLDLGGESTRPGSEPVSAQEEMDRVLPVLEALRARHPELPLSVDTTKPEVAREALKLGADLINDVSGLSGGAEMVEMLKESGAGYVLMHTQGTPKTMQKAPEYGHPLVDVFAFLQERLDFCIAEGLKTSAILVDPGIGFGKTLEHNLELLRMNQAFSALGCGVLLGSSNKSFLEKALGLKLDQRAAANLAGQVLGFERGAQVFRVHEVLQTRRALDLAWTYRTFGL